ncbi:PE-PPE domain-containing protein [Candidatus Saccharibacteria bacterium]|nr:PE-PPE domain-containing protein [Candidatus Saccharibacteria bacterium]
MINTEFKKDNNVYETGAEPAEFNGVITDLDAWNAEDETFMELAAKQEAIKRDLAAIAIPSYTLEKPKNTSEELREDIKPTLGAYANVAALGAFNKVGGWYQRFQQRSAERQKKYAAKATDTTGERIFKSFQRGRNKILGGVAAAAVIGLEGVLVYNRLKGMDFHAPLRHYNYDSTAYATSYEFGGRGDPSAAGVMNAKRADGSLREGVNYVGVNYPATIAPVDAGPTLDQSTGMGADAAFQDYLRKKDSGQDFYAEGFSEGSIAALKFAQQVKADNGGVMPDNFHLVLEGSPVTSTGFFRSSTAQNPMIKPMLQSLGINPDTGEVPAGTIARYSQNDVWANGANQSLLGQGVMALDLEHGHAIENPNAPKVVWIDAEGVRHEEYDVGVHPFTQLIRANGTPVNGGFNNFFQDVVPINSNVNGSELAKPNGRQAAMDLAQGIDMETGNTGIPQKVMAAVPESFHNVIQDGLDLANSAPDKIAQDPSKIGEVMGDVNKMVNDVFKALPSETNTPVQDFAHGVVQNVVPPEFQQTANNIVTQVFQQLPPAPQIQQPAPLPTSLPEVAAALPAPAAPAPAPAPAVPDLNQLTNVANDFLGGLFAPKR